MPQESFFDQWARDFDHRLRFGIPTLPPTTQEALVPPTIVQLPPRAGAFRYPPEDVNAVLELLGQCTPGQAVALGDPEDNDNAARRKAETMKQQIMDLGDNVIADGYKLRGHVLTAGEPTRSSRESSRTPGRFYAIVSYPENTPALSLVRADEPDEPAPDAEPDDGFVIPNRADTAAEVATDAPEATGRRRNRSS